MAKTKKNVDLFEHPELLPNDVLVILEKYENMDEDYKICEQLIAELNTVGYTCDYDLDGIPYDLKKL
jgi:hypothetical protein